MNIVVVGLGSMGKRRIRLTQKYIQNNSLADWSIIGVDFDENRCKEAISEYGIEAVSDLNDVIDECDALIVSTPPLSHASIVEAALNAGKHVFTEINLVSDGYEENIRRAADVGKVLFLSSTFLYRDEIKFIAEKIASAKRGSYSYHVGQYLPDWHPWEDYRSFFVADKRTSACRELFAIELPWLRFAFGEIAEVLVVHRKQSDLELPYDDSFALIIQHDSGSIGTVRVDVVSRRAVRNFEFSSEDEYLVWDGSATGLYELDIDSGRLMNIDLYGNGAEQRDDYASFVVENAYYNELEAFFRTIEDDFNPLYGYEEDLRTLELIDDIERG